MTTQTARCPRCGDPFPDGLEAKDFEGICPNCLAFLAVDPSSDVVPSAPGDPLQLAAKDPPPLKRGATFHGMEMLAKIPVMRPPVNTGEDKTQRRLSRIARRRRPDLWRSSCTSRSPGRKSMTGLRFHPVSCSRVLLAEASMINVGHRPFSSPVR